MPIGSNEKRLLDLCRVSRGSDQYCSQPRQSEQKRRSPTTGTVAPSNQTPPAAIRKCDHLSQGPYQQKFGIEMVSLRSQRSRFDSNHEISSSGNKRIPDCRYHRHRRFSLITPKRVIFDCCGISKGIRYPMNAPLRLVAPRFQNNICPRRARQTRSHKTTAP